MNPVPVSITHYSLVAPSNHTHVSAPIHTPRVMLEHSKKAVRIATGGLQVTSSTTRGIGLSNSIVFHRFSSFKISILNICVGLVVIK